MGEFPSGQRGQTVNLLSLTSLVRIQLPPPKQKGHRMVSFLFWQREASSGSLLVFDKDLVRSFSISRCQRRGSPKMLDIFGGSRIASIRLEKKPRIARIHMLPLSIPFRHRMVSFLFWRREASSDSAPKLCFGEAGDRAIASSAVRLRIPILILI